MSSENEGSMTVNASINDPGSQSPRGNAGGSGNSSGGNRGNGLQFGASFSRAIGDNMARSHGINPADFTGYFVNVDGNVIGISPLVGGDAAGVNLGMPNDSGENGGDLGRKYNAPLGGAFAGDTSEARKAALIKTVNDNAASAGSKQSGRRITKARNEIENAQRQLAQINYTRDDIATAAKITSDFFQEVTARFGERASNLAQSFAAESKGKKLRNVEEALAAFNHYKNSLGVKFSTQDRNAIYSALKSLDYANMAKHLSAYSKGFGYYGKFSDLYDINQELIKAVETDNWRPFFVKIETFTAGKVAAAITAFAFSIIVGAPIGIVSFAIIMATVGALVNDKLINDINTSLGI